MNIIRRGRTLFLAGDFDVRSTTEVRDALNDHLAEVADDPGPDAALVVDLTRVETIDSTALRVLAMATRRASRSGRHLVLRGACPAVRRMLHLTRLIRVVELERQPRRRADPVGAVQRSGVSD